MAKDVKKTVQVDSDTYAGLQRLAAVETHPPESVTL